MCFGTVLVQSADLGVAAYPEVIPKPDRDIVGSEEARVKRWPPSAAQTGRAVFPHPAFMNGLLRPETKGSVRPALPA